MVQNLPLSFSITVPLFPAVLATNLSLDLIIFSYFCKNVPPLDQKSCSFRDFVHFLFYFRRLGRYEDLLYVYRRSHMYLEPPRVSSRKFGLGWKYRHGSSTHHCTVPLILHEIPFVNDTEVLWILICDIQQVSVIKYIIPPKTHLPLFLSFCLSFPFPLGGGGSSPHWMKPCLLYVYRTSYMYIEDSICIQDIPYVYRTYISSPLLCCC